MSPLLSWTPSITAFRMAFAALMYRRAVSDIRAVLNKAMDIVNEVRA